MNIIYLRIVYSVSAESKWHTIFKCYLFTGIIWCCSCYFCNCYFLLVSIYALLDLSIEVLIPIWLSSLHIPRDSSFILEQSLVLILGGWFGVLSIKFIIFWYSIIILYYYINVRSLIIFSHSSGDTHLSLGTSLLRSFVFVSELFCGELLETLVISYDFAIALGILLPIKSPVAFAIFLY